MPDVLRPFTLAPPRGYANGLVFAPGRIVFVAGQIGWDREGKIVSRDFAAQFDQALFNVLEVVRAAGGRAEHVGRMTVFVADKTAYERSLKEVGRAWRARMGRHYPAMSLVQVAALLEPGALVEIEATAVVPHPPGPPPRGGG